jgi:hypothetical protein
MPNPDLSGSRATCPVEFNGSCKFIKLLLAISTSMKLFPLANPDMPICDGLFLPRTKWLISAHFLLDRTIGGISRFSPANPVRQFSFLRISSIPTPFLFGTSPGYVPQYSRRELSLLSLVPLTPSKILPRFSQQTSNSSELLGPLEPRALTYSRNLPPS